MSPFLPESILVTGGSGLEISVSLQELTTACRKIIGREMPVSTEPENRQADLRVSLADCSGLFARTHWRPKRGVAQIVTDIFVWVRAHEKELRPLV